MRIMLSALALALCACSAPNHDPGAPADSAIATPSRGSDGNAPARARAPASGPETSSSPVAAAAAPDPVKPFPAGLSGELLFQSDREGPTRLYVLDLSTGGVRRVGAAGDWVDEEPRWSNDGRRIAF